MTYKDHFRLADDIITHVNTVISDIKDPFISSRYIGFISVSAVTVYELAIKEIFCEFANQQHEILGSFVLKHFERINGQIKLDKIKRDYIPRFGQKYVDKFQEKIDECEDNNLKTLKRSIKSSYHNIIEWRNQFAHEGEIPTTPTYEETTNSYFAGKEVIDCLFKTMHH